MEYALTSILESTLTRWPVRRLMSTVESRAVRILAKSNTHTAEPVGPSLSSGLEEGQEGEGEGEGEVKMGSAIQASALVHGGYMQRTLRPGTQHKPGQ